MLCPFEEHEFQQLSNVIQETVRTTVAADADEATFLITDIEHSLKKWFVDGAKGYSQAYRVDDELVGFIVVKEFWNLSHLFVLPHYQNRGIGSTLVMAAIEYCKDKSPRNKIQLNSSNSAVAFYERSGFTRCGEGIDRPGGSNPFEYVFDNVS